MPSARIHEAIAKNINKKYNMDELLLRIGTVSPDCWRNVPADSGVKDKYLSHFWDFRIKNGEANDFIEFYFKYYENLNNPFYFGYLVHLIVDQYWKTYIDPRYIQSENGVDYVRLHNGSIIKDENWFSYFESLKMQKQIARIYNLGAFPINKDEIDNFECEIDELNLNGLFGKNGTLNYINSDIMPTNEDKESIVYDNESILRAIDETTEYVFKELEKLSQLKKEYDAKTKIAIDIDDTILCTKELEEKYWIIFLSNHPEINPNKEYKWGDSELTLFWKEHREDMAFGTVKEDVSAAFKELKEKGYILDLLSARPLEKYASLKKRLVEHFEKVNVEYSHINLGFYSKIEFLKEHKYDILIDNDIRHIEQANEEGIITILFGPYNGNYSGIQTNNWSEIPVLVENALSSRKSL